MNSENFMKWVRTQLIPNLPPQSILIIDNASYHNVVINREPTSSTKKSEMIQWLIERNIVHDATKTKPELYAIIKLYKNKCRQYVLDTEMAKHGHRVLRLPPYHPELNPIEKIWALVKNYVASNNVSFKLDDVKSLAIEKFEAISAADWEAICDHVNHIVEDYLKKEYITDEMHDNLGLNITITDSDDEDDLSEEENNEQQCSESEEE